MRMLRGESGATLIELAIAFGLVLVGAYFGYGGLEALRSTSKATQTLSANERQIAAILDNLRTGADAYQVNYEFSAASREALLSPERLPMAWDIGRIVPVAECEKCPGRYGYVLQPVEAYRGLYRVNLRVTHRDWKGAPKDYEFLVTIK